MWRNLANANKTPYRGPQGPTEFKREALRGPQGPREFDNKYLAPPGECQFLTEARKGRENSSAIRRTESRRAETIERG